MTVRNGPVKHWRQPNRRLFLQHGPIELIAQADGSEAEREQAFDQLSVAFDSVLDTLVHELSWLRLPASDRSEYTFVGPVAKRMEKACAQFESCFVTPMAAVAGSVADHMLLAMTAGRTLSRVSVNNGGDIALHVSEQNSYTIGICDNLKSTTPTTQAKIDSSSLIGGVATSGWQGRSHSLGIADAVTVLASNAAVADVAATLIGNEVNLPQSANIERIEATELTPQSDLGSRLVTVSVPELSPSDIQQALHKGQEFAKRLVEQRLIHSAYLSLQGNTVVVARSHELDWRETA